MINVGDIKDGDVVSVSDGYNRARGTLYRDARLNLCLRAFGQSVIVLKRSPGDRMTLQKPLKIDDHQPTLFA